jgi:hypothetical protein
MRFWRTTPRRPTVAELKLRDLETECDTLRRQIAILEAERDALAGVIARDRERVRAETAGFTRAVVDATGGP